MEKSIPIRSGAYDINLTHPKIYAVTEDKRGYAVIINNFKFDKKNFDLPGGEEDSRRLKETFEGLKLIVDLKENLSGMEIKNLLIRYSQKDHSAYGCFVCVLSSHGAYEKIIGTDHVEVHLPKVLQNIFDCTSLTGKPKLVFIDACRKYDQHFSLELPRTVPDYMICYSALPGTTANMMDAADRLEGSRFIKSMCDVFRVYGENEQLDYLLTKLKQAVNDGSKNLQNVEITESLTKMFFFTPDKWICESCHSCNAIDVCLTCTHRATQNNEVSSSDVDLQECKSRITPGPLMWEDKTEEKPITNYLSQGGNQYNKEKNIPVPADTSTTFFKLYSYNPDLFLHDKFLSLTEDDIDSLCENEAEFKIIPAKYPSSVVFMSQLDSKWIRFSEEDEKYTKFRFIRANHSFEGVEFLHIESADYPQHYLTMGFLGWWVRAKFHLDRVTEADAFWDIRCLKTNDGKGNVLSKYMLVPKNSKDFVCVDRTNRLKGGDGKLDITKMFIFKRVKRGHSNQKIW